MSGPVSVSLLTEDDIPGAIDSIQEAFADDPYHHWIFDDQSKFSPERNRISLDLRCRWGMRNALFHVAKDADTQQVLGVAMWLRPQAHNEPPSWQEWSEGWLLWLQQIGMNLRYGHGGLNVRRYYIWKSAQQALHDELWKDPRGYYFCNIVTVRPEAQGRGVGKSLMKKVLDQADKEGVMCYLESSRAEPNIAIYERMGFYAVREMECDDKGVKVKVRVTAPILRYTYNSPSLRSLYVQYVNNQQPSRPRMRLDDLMLTSLPTFPQYLRVSWDILTTQLFCMMRDSKPVQGDNGSAGTS
ncbi:MAG: hypothetical protein M4579_005295 [Chaenotheca gracillima]|nr:MAG: hypothetical protein M4579_005295 [Chaenotheca gracillima]